MHKKENLKVLVVNDDPMSLLVLQTMLIQVCGIKDKNVSTATNGLEGYQVATQYQFDIILMDLHMHTMGGLESCRRIKDTCHQDKMGMLKKEDSSSLLHHASIPYIVAISASNYDDDLMRQCKKAGFDDQFSLPITAADF